MIAVSVPTDKPQIMESAVSFSNPEDISIIPSKILIIQRTPGVKILLSARMARKQDDLLSSNVPQTLYHQILRRRRFNKHVLETFKMTVEEEEQ